MKRPLAYITAPWSNSQYENAENAAAYCRQVYDAGYSPICPVLFLPIFLTDEIPQEHKDGLDILSGSLCTIDSFLYYQGDQPGKIRIQLYSTGN